jgi:hypothetical protein
MIPIANAQNEFKVFLIANLLRLAYVRKINGGDAWKVENGTLHFDPTKKTIKGRFRLTDKYIFI